MESETKKEKNTIKTMIVCPVCQVSGYIYLPKENFNKSKKGVSSILLSNTGICPHSYQIFVDKNGAVRGYETPDFELKFVATEKKPEEEEKLGTIGSLQIIRALLGEELLFKCIRTALIGDQIYCLTDNNYLVKFFKQFFESIFENYYKDKITVTSVENYNEKDRMKIFGTDYQKAHQNILIINPDLSVIIKEPFKKNYKDKHFKFEQSIMNTINTKKQNEQEIIDALKIVITDIFTGLNETKELIEKKVVQNEREMEIWIGKKAGKKIDVDADVLVKMYFNRFDLNVEDVFKNQGYGQNIRSI